MVGPNGTVKSATILSVLPVLAQAGFDAKWDTGPHETKKIVALNFPSRIVGPWSRRRSGYAKDLAVCSFSTPWIAVKRERRLMKFAVMTRGSRRLRPVVRLNHELVIATRCLFFVHFADFWCRKSTFPLWPDRRAFPEALRSILETTRFIFLHARNTSDCRITRL